MAASTPKDTNDLVWVPKTVGFELYAMPHKPTNIKPRATIVFINV